MQLIMSLAVCLVCLMSWSSDYLLLAGAKAIDQQPLNRIECHGKNLFYFFGEGDDTVVLHVHFGMSGAFRTLPRGDAPPETTPNTRLLLTGERIVALLSAMIVQHGSMGESYIKHGCNCSSRCCPVCHLLCCLHLTSVAYLRFDFVSSACVLLLLFGSSWSGSCIVRVHLEVEFPCLGISIDKSTVLAKTLNVFLVCRAV